MLNSFYLFFCVLSLIMMVLVNSVRSDIKKEARVRDNEEAERIRVATIEIEDNF